MGSYYQDLTKFAEERGWTVSRCANSHLKLTHPKVPRPIFTSATPSDVKVLILTKTEIRRAERHAGLNVPDVRKGGRVPIETFQQEALPGGGIRNTATCSKCGFKDHIDRSSDAVMLPPVHIAQRFRGKGWHVKTYRKEDLCPRCRNGTKEVKEAAPNAAVPVSRIEPTIVLAEPKKPDPATINIAALNRQQLAQKRKIAALLSKVYLPDIGYLPGESDATVAAKSGAVRELVEIVRADYYGAARKTTPLDMVKRAIVSYRRDLKAFEQDVIDKVAKLEADAGAILKWLDQLDDSALPARAEQEAEPELPGLMNGRAA
jgi:hypothetical protein